MIKKLLTSVILFIGYAPVYAQRYRGHDGIGRGMDGPEQTFSEWLISNLKIFGILIVIFIGFAIYVRIKDSIDEDK